MPEHDPPSPPIPESRAVPKKRTRFSLVWFIPIVAAIVGAWVAVTRVLGQGPEITIVFKTAEGLDAGKTKIHYNGVDVGTITAIRLTDDHRQAIATAQMAPKTDEFLVEGTKFWVVKPRISGANISGLGTLISGAYIGMEIGTSKQEKRNFVALDAPPVVSGEMPGRFFILKTLDLGSIDTGTPILFRRLQVGQVASYELDKDGKYLTVKIFVRAPYDQYVNPNTRFWHASGFDLSLTANGLKVQTQSLLSIIIGGIAFETAPTALVLPPAEEKALFLLYGNRTEAFNPPPRNPQTYQLVFKDTVRGLTPGAPVEFRGIPIGEVTDISAQIDLKTFEFAVPVLIRLDPQRLGVKVFDLGPGSNLETARRKLIDALVAHGVRAQLRTGNLLTGSAYVALDVFPSAPKTAVDWTQSPVQLPTTAGQFANAEATVEDILNKLDKMPLKEIGDNLNKAITDLDLTLTSARGTLTSAQGTFDNTSNLTGANSSQVQQLNETLREVSRAARSLRVLADYLEGHPESLIRGKKGEAK
ncbi:MAG TPA: MlaD family protein [Candidatus Dormibacteraeota bacterium]|nr:MlaD family protein [Candidatus Dormibacteraeota bacterium]